MYCELWRKRNRPVCVKEEQTEHKKIDDYLLLAYLTSHLYEYFFFWYYLINLSQICIKAALYQTEFRPVPLEEYIKVGNSIYNKSMELCRIISKAAELGGKDPDHVVELCNEVGGLES